MSIKIDQYQIYPTIFPDGTSQVWKLPDAVLGHEKVVIEWEFSHEGEFMHLAQLKALLDSFAIEASLRLPYLPYGRQDKDIDNRKTFALLTFANLLNSLLFRSITIIDPHSHIAELMIDRSSAIYPVDELNIVRTKCKSDLVCYPDKGAVTKYVKIYTDFDWVHGEKVRDQESGHILSYELVGSVAGKNVLIVDDICDGGATFTILAKALFEAGAKAVDLFVTHGIFSKGLRPLHNARIGNVFTRKGIAVEIDDRTTGWRPYDTN